jgi:hypothetical protein
MQQIRTLEDLLAVNGAEATVAKLRDGPEGSPALRRQVTRVLAAWSQQSVNGRDEPEPPARLPSLFDRVRKMLGQEMLGLCVEPGEAVREFFLKSDVL